MDCDDSPLTVEDSVEILGRAQRDGLDKKTVGALPDKMTCDVCGCTDEYACPRGCYWVADRLCSSCA